jgi:putative membrane protein
MSLLGALLTFSSRPWYAPYIETAPRWGITALADQQLGGLIMWIPAGTVLLFVALTLFVKWMHISEERGKHTRTADLVRAAAEARYDS